MVRRSPALRRRESPLFNVDRRLRRAIVDLISPTMFATSSRSCNTQPRPNPWPFARVRVSSGELAAASPLFVADRRSRRPILNLFTMDELALPP
jgi:hypothetical protein